MESTFICRECSIIFSNYIAYLEHIQNVNHKKDLTVIKTLETKDVLYHNVNNQQPSSSTQIKSFNCEICKIPCTGPDQYNQHINGKNHQKQLKKQEALRNIQTASSSKSLNTLEPMHINGKSQSSIFNCTICNLPSLDPEQYQQHIFGKNHQKQLRKQEFLNIIQTASPIQPLDTPEIAQINENSQPLVFNCTLCNMSSLGPENYQQHINGKNHKKQLEKQEILRKLQNISPTQSFHTPETAPSNGKNQSTGFNCAICKTPYLDPENYQQHINGKNHQKQLEKQEILRKLQNVSPTQSCHTVDTAPSNGKNQSTGLNCTICDTPYLDPENYQQHLNGKNHQKQLEKQRYLKIVETTTLTQPLKMHKSVTEHEEVKFNSLSNSYNKKINQICHEESSDINNKISYDIKISLPGSPLTQKNDYYCDICDTPLSGPGPYQDHIRGKKHKKKEMNLNLSGTNYISSPHEKVMKKENLIEEPNNTDDDSCTNRSDFRILDEDTDSKCFVDFEFKNITQNASLVKAIDDLHVTCIGPGEKITL